MADPFLHTKRLRWRPVQAGDAPLYAAVLSDYEVVRMLGSWPWPPDPDAVRERLEKWLETKGLLGPIFLGEEMIGGMGVEATDPGEAEIGYMLARAHWGHGYATEMGAALIARAFARPDLRCIRATTWADNPASARVLQKLGFVPDGGGMDYCKARGEEVASHAHVLTREAWAARDD
ncbi:MAG: GNAT family N-acetyltransferase [Rhodobacterales bacterium]|nr:MAG: GNAT family N-acetyltransferase [Rhodobacterales bacterium]